MNELHEEFRQRGLTVLLVNMREDPELVRRTVKTRGYTAPVALDTGGAVSAAYRVTGTPTVFLIDRRLDLVGRAIGRRDWAGTDGRRLLETLLGP